MSTLKYTRFLFVAGLSLLLFSATVTAQQPGFGARALTHPVVVTPPITNPTVLRAQNPTYTTVVPPTISPPVWGYSPWTGPVLWPGVSTPPYVIQQSYNRYIRLPDGRVWNPVTGTFYSPYFNTFTGASGTYYPNPWTGTYNNPVTGAMYNPWTGTTVTPYWGNPNPWYYQRSP